MGVVKVMWPRSRRPERKPKGVEPGPATHQGARSGCRKPHKGSGFPRNPNGAAAAGGGAGEQIVTIIDGKSGARQEVKILRPREQPIQGRFAADRDNSQWSDPTHRRRCLRARKPMQAGLQADELAPNRHRDHGLVFRPTAPRMQSTSCLAITFAFGPYGVDLERVTGRASGLGHELLLQFLWSLSTIGERSRPQSSSLR